MPVINGVPVAIPPPEGYVVNFKHPQRRHETEAYVASSVGMGLAFFFVLQYLYVKVWILRKLELETACLIIGWIFSIGVQVVALQGFFLGITGVHTWEIPLAKFNTGNQLSFVIPILYAVCTAFSKMALALFYRKLSPERWWRWSVCGVLFLVAGYNLAIMLVILFGCAPFAKSWDHTMLEGTCVNRPAVYICTAGLGILSDLILLIMPLPMVLRSRIPRRQKAGLVVLFAIGSATLVTSVIRLVLLVPIFGALDVSWIISGAIVWVFIEANLLIICASLTTLRCFFYRVAPTIIGVRVSSNGIESSKGTRKHPFQTIETFGGKSKSRRGQPDSPTVDPGFDLKTIARAQPVRTEVTVFTPDEERDETIKQLRREKSIKKFGCAAVETQTWNTCKDGSDDEELAIVQTTTVTVVYGPRESYMPPNKVEDMA
ncbi:hypothetical protein FPSE_09452 [Fusarium pseudograminearum CS3096]|uniref:Rhodopsin domain-containing protein n=1 Tax=Fusarium pseudograminearum (strain CS3096) TaxID=1028729 RepID=K3VDB4_FUSPC|nr:hypothetical protein FPSE_09452 [Fusarium pseudograminearum CS3096]EKJ70458.1 hypothetical protein FPSE_09452 [Fusarium pseudograminearum CS3096]